MSSHRFQSLASPPGTQASEANSARADHLSSSPAGAHRRQWAGLLHEALAAHGVSDATVATRLGVSKSVAQHIRHGLDRLPVERLALLGSALEISVLEARIRWLKSQRVPSQVPVVTRALHCSAAAGAVAARVAEAVADGEVDAAEQRDIAKLTCKLKGASELLLDDCAQGGR